MTNDSESQEFKPYLKDRETMGHFAAKTVSAGKLQKYQEEWNSRSLDGLPGLRSALQDSGYSSWRQELENWLNKHRDDVKAVKLLAVVFIIAAFFLK